MPDTCNSWGEPIEPADRMTSRRACKSSSLPDLRRRRPVHRIGPSFAEKVRLCAWASVQTLKLDRCRMGRRKALLALQRQQAPLVDFEIADS